MPKCTEISWTRCPSLESVPKTAQWLCWYPGFGEVSIATEHKENLGVYIVQLIYAITAIFKSFRLREKPDNVRCNSPSDEFFPFVSSPQQFLCLRLCVHGSLFFYLFQSPSLGKHSLYSSCWKAIESQIFQLSERPSPDCTARYTLLKAAVANISVGYWAVSFHLENRTGMYTHFWSIHPDFSAKLPGSSGQHHHQLFLHGPPWYMGSTETRNTLNSSSVPWDHRFKPGGDLPVCFLSSTQTRPCH